MPRSSIELLQLGDYLYINQNYEASVTEYWRFLCFHPNHPYTFYAYYKAGMAYTQIEDWKSATSLLLCRHVIFPGK